VARTLLGALLNRTPVPYVSGRSNISIPWRAPTGAEAQMRAMGTVGTLFAIVNRTSNAAAQVEWKLYRKAASGLPEDRTEVTSHAALDLWNKPNRFFTRQELVETVQQHIDLTGEGWLIIARNPRSPIPLELWPVRPDRMQPIPDPTDFISGYMYTGPDGREVALRVEDVIFIRMPNPLDPYRGMGPVQSVLTEIDAARYSAEWNRNFFMNSAEPSGIIEVPNVLSDPEFDQLRERWNEQHKGVANAHKVAILEHGKWVDRKYTQRDMQFAELRQVSRDVMREAFGAPAFVLGEVGDVNRATADASKALFAEQLTVPRLERFKGALNNDLLSLYGPDAVRTLEFDYNDPVPPDADARNAEITAKSAAWKVLVDGGADPALASEYLGLPDLGYRPPAPPVAPAAPAPAAVPAARVDLHHHMPFTPAARQLPSYNTVLARPRPPLPRAAAAEQDLGPVREQFDDALTQLLDAWEPVAEDQYTALEQQIEKAVDAGDTEALAGLAVDSDRSARVLRQALGDMAETAAKQMATEAGEQGVKVRPPKVDKGLRNAFGSELIEIAAATAALLGADAAASAGREALRLMVPGARGSEVAQKVGGFLRGLKNWFRRDQLGGALHRAQNAGRIATLQAAPTARYFASEQNDRSTCLPCKEIDGTEFEDLAAAQAVYGSGGYQACEGGIRCRGTITAVWDTTTTEASMGRTRRAWNTASPEQIADRARAMRPALPAPGDEQGWYRITNAMPDGMGDPCLYIYGDIGSWGITAGQCVQELAELDAPVIDVYINSPGGEVFDGLAIYNALRSHPAKVMVRVDALAASIASVIAMAGDRVTMSPGSQLMIHDANGVACGEPDELRKYADFLDAQSDNIAAIYAERAGGTAKQWRARMQAETWYFAEEAVAAGLADEVAKPARQDTTAEAAAMAAAWDLSVYNYAHTSRDDAPAPPLDTACPTHHTATVDSPWDAGPNERRLPSPMTLATAKKMYGWYDPAQVDNGELPKSACKFPHHEVSADGNPGAANLAACRNGLARLPQSDVPEAQRAAVERHLRAHLADGGGSDNHVHDAPAAVFDPDVFRAATQAALDPMPGYQPDHLRSLMAGLAGDAPAAPEPVRPDAPYVPRPADTVPNADPETVAVGWFRSLFQGVANNAPAPPPTDRPAPAPPAPVPEHTPEPPRPAGEVAVDYMRTLMANAAQDLAAPEQAAAPGPAPAEPVPAIDPKSFERSLREAEL
jgi:HK97 family phage portal protein